MGSSRHLPADVYGLRSIAILELLKAAGAIGAGVLLVLHPHASFGHLAERILHVLHIHRNSDVAVAVISWARRIEIRHVHWMVLFIAIYVALRIAEGYGLWLARRWAEWFGVINGTVYLPIEILELTKGFNWVKVSVLLINITVVAYLGWELKKGRKSGPEPRQPAMAGITAREPVHRSNL